MKKIVDDVRAKLEVKHGSGPGFALDTKVLMADKTVKEIKDIKVGDVVCGDDNSVRVVTSVEFGEGMMCLVKQSKGDDYVVGTTHALVFKATGVTPYLGTINLKKNVHGIKHTLVYNVKCENGKCIPNCSKKGIKKRGLESYSESAMMDKKNELLEGSLDKDYVKNGDIFTIKIQDHINICAKQLRDNHLQCYKASYPVFNITKDDLPIDPYFLGLWLGDGDAQRVAITSNDLEIDKYLYDFILQYDGMKITKRTLKAGANNSSGIKTVNDCHWYQLTYGNGKRNQIHSKLRALGLLKNKHIPDIYMNASEKSRFELLAGLLDSDGYLHFTNNVNEVDENIGPMYYVFRQTEVHKTLIFQSYKLAQSLGINVTKMMEQLCTPVGNKVTFKDGQSTHISYCFKMTGEKILKIPCLIERKKTNNKREEYNFITTNTSRIKIIRLDEPQKYIKINVDSNHKFLLSDCTVVHDCSI